MFKKFINAVFPMKCIFCGKILTLYSENEICEECQKELFFLYNNSPQIIFAGSDTDYCDGIVFVCEYNGIVKNSIIKYKFYDKPGYHRAFANIIYKKLLKTKEYSDIDIILSVPLHKKRESIRGYNQSLLISRQLSKIMKIKETSYVLRRTVNTEAQSSLDKSARMKNVKNAFEVIFTDDIKNKSILLIDDILTTGNTINECCKVLKRAGANKVFAAVIASGRKY